MAKFSEGFFFRTNKNRAILVHKKSSIGLRFFRTGFTTPPLATTSFAMSTSTPDSTPAVSTSKRGQKRSKKEASSGEAGDIGKASEAKIAKADSQVGALTEAEVLDKMSTGDYFLKITKPQQVIAASKRRKPLIYVQGLSAVSGSTGRKRRRSSKDEPKRMTDYNLYMKHRVHEIKEQTGLKHADAFLQAANEWKTSPANPSIKASNSSSTADKSE